MQSNLVSIEEYNRLQKELRQLKNNTGKLEAQIYNQKSEINDLKLNIQSQKNDTITDVTEPTSSFTKKE